MSFDKLDFFLKTNDREIQLFIIFGSKRRILRDGIIPSIDNILKMPIPIIGICYGFQYLAMRSGGILEDGEILLKDSSKSITVDYSGKQTSLNIWRNHYDKVTNLPVKEVDKKSYIKTLWDIDIKVDNIIYMAHTDKWIGYQFHPEYSNKNFEEFLLPFLR